MKKAVKGVKWGGEKKGATIRKVKAPPPSPGSKWRRKSNGLIYILMGYGLMEVEAANYVIYRDLKPQGIIWLMPIQDFFKQFDLFKAAPNQKTVQKPKQLPGLDEHGNPPDPGAKTFTHADLVKMGKKKREKMN